MPGRVFTSRGMRPSPTAAGSLTRLTCIAVLLTRVGKGESVPIQPLPPSWPLDPAAESRWLAQATPDELRAAVVRLASRVSALEWEKATLTFAAESFGALAERLNQALRAIRDTPRV